MLFLHLSLRSCSLLHETKHLIKRDDTDVPRLFEIQSYFQYFSKYLAFGDVLKAVQDNDDVMREYVESLHAAVDEEILYGTDSTDRVANIDRLNKSIRALSALDGKFSIQFATNRIVHKVTTFQKNILIDMEQDFVGLGIRLSKLKIWCEFVPPELNFLYDDLVSNLSRLVQKSVDAIASFSLTELERIEVTGFVTLVSHLSRLKQLMDERTKGRSIRELNIHVVSRALFGALGRISRSLETWGADCDSTLRTLDFNDESVVNTLKARAETLEIMAEVMRHASLHFKISETVGLLSLTILVETTQKFDAVCTDLEWNQSKFDSSWKSRMLTLRDASYAFGKLQDNGWSQMGASFVSLVETITGLIKKKSGELHEMAQDAYDHGLRDGKRNAGALSAFEALTWFDQLLLPENRFVENTAFAARRMYDDKGAKLKGLTDEILDELSRPFDGTQASTLVELKIYIYEITQLSAFGLAVSSRGLVQLRDHLKTSLDAYAISRLESWSEMTTQWDRMVEDWNPEELRVLNLSLGDSLEEIAILLQLLEECESDATGSLRTNQGRIRTSMRAFSNVIKNCFESSDYEEMARAYACVETIGNHQCTSSYLPECQELREQARHIVSLHATAIEETVARTSKWDQMDSLIKGFEKAVVLDEAMGLDVSSRLGPLKRIRDGKEEEVDDVLASMIEKQDYAGIKGFLVPLSQSKDQVRLQKFNKCLSAIISSLKAIESKLKREVEADIAEDSLEQVNHGLEILECADHELGPQLRQKYDVRVKIELIKQRIWRRVEDLIGKASRAANEFDLMILKENFDLVVIYSNSLGNHFSSRVKKRSDDCLNQSNNLLNSVPSRIDQFVKSVFKDEMDLTSILSSLKRAHESNDPDMEVLGKLYNESTTRLGERINSAVSSHRQVVAKRECYDDSIDVLQDLEHSLGRGLKTHLPSQLSSDCRDLLEAWKDARRESENELQFNSSNAEEALDGISARLEKLKASAECKPLNSWFKSTMNQLTSYVKQDTTGKSYQNMTSRLEKLAGTWHGNGVNALASRDHSRVQECMHILKMMESKIGKHVLPAGVRLRELKSETKKEFLLFCDTVSLSLESGKSQEFERSFADYRGFVLYVPFLSADADVSKKMKLIHQSLFVWMRKEIDSALQSMKTFEFREIKERVKSTRAFGGFVADRFSLLHEEFNRHAHLEIDEWLDKLVSDVIFKHFSVGRDLGGLKYFAALGAVPSAHPRAIKKAWKSQSVKFHPDKCKDPKKKEESTAKFRQITEAYEELQKRFEHRIESPAKPFDKEVKAIGSYVTATVKEALAEQHYESVASLLAKFGEMDLLDDLVEPSIETALIKKEVFKLVARQVESARIDIDTRWFERNYKDLNHSITDLKLMEGKFSSYPEVFDKSWNTGIVAKIEDEILVLGQKARTYLCDKATAKAHCDDFRRCFLGMGAVLVELPIFKDFTKRAMSDVLEVCLASDWGYSYLFELGLSLRKSEDLDNDDDIRIAHMILGQFKQFKEVLTMVWNEETVQKPVEDTVQDILVQRLENHAPVTRLSDAHMSTLKDKFFEFEMQYKSVLGTYLGQDADLKDLVRSTAAIANGLKPVSRDSFSSSVKDGIPRLLACVFGLFTVLKSGESYNRLEESSEITIDANKLLLKPHNIQVVTLLCLFGCQDASVDHLQSQLMQIRTGEGKSIILGAAAVLLGLLGFQVRCVCYSDYLSQRDFELFREVFEHFSLMESTKYSKITSFSEDMAAAKGDIRELTLSLMRGMGQNPNALVSASPGQLVVKSENILLVDEVDVFFSGSFYGQTYNKVAFLKEPEIVTILIEIWSASSEGRKKVRLGHIQRMAEYSALMKKYCGFEFCIENEIVRMLDEVRRLDETPYHLDYSTDRIGHKVMDSVSFEVNFGYRTVFAYLKEADQLQDRSGTLERELGMLISCGQFSFANISPDAILGVSGTLQVMGEYERNVLKKYGVQRFMYVPSVYGKSNFQFDKAGDGISIESSLSDYYQKIVGVLIEMSRLKRAGIVFFQDSERLNDFIASPFYRKLGRNKSVLRENMTVSEKEFVISKAATAGQVTICSSVFGRGTDFFCKDETVEKNGGVHVIQGFFSSEESEEIQIQGRTARQGKKGTFSMVLLEKDLEHGFGIACGSAENWSRNERYQKLCDGRKHTHAALCVAMDSDLKEATEKDRATESYFDALCLGDQTLSKAKFEEVYLSMKKRKAPTVMTLELAFAVDNTGSMAPYGVAIESTVSSMLHGSNSLANKLANAFPDTSFKVRCALLGYRDIDDGADQFLEHTWTNSGSHFTDNMGHILQVTKQLVHKAAGGGDVAEDHVGAIQHCAAWNAPGDWDESSIKVLLLLTDAPAHQFVPASLATHMSDKYSSKHPAGLTVEAVADQMINKDIELFVSSFDPVATSSFEDYVRDTFAEHKDNAGDIEVVSIPMVETRQLQASSGAVDPVNSGIKRHIIFVLDESGSMQNEWSGVVVAYNNYVTRRRQQQFESDLVSVVQFDGGARVTVSQVSIVSAPSSLEYSGGGTCFSPAATAACNLARQTPPLHLPLVVFMSDGQADDAQTAANSFAALNREITIRYGSELELHVIAFGSANSGQLQTIANSSTKGQLHSAASTYDLSNVFVQIAGGGEKIASVLKEEIGKRVLDAVSDRIVAEYSA